ncbi:MAG TPA: hypothetical protein VME43_25825, partial [Bryobacteraceae bacterium]|nr:hypothetical protein [Bryobacteraceae bacterium]
MPSAPGSEWPDETAEFLELAADYAQRLAEGEAPQKITAQYTGACKKIADGFNSLIDMMHLRSADIEALLTASLEGKLETRIDTRKYAGGHGQMMHSINAMLDAILLPIGEGNRILAQISNGKIDELIAHTYKGDHEKMKQAVNQVGVVIQSLQKELIRLTDASREGQLSERGKPE